MDFTYVIRLPGVAGGNSAFARTRTQGLYDTALLAGRMVPGYPPELNVVLARVAVAVYAELKELNT